MPPIPFKLLVIDRMHDSLQRYLAPLPLKVDYQPDIDRTGLLERIAPYQGLMLRSKTRVDEALVSKAENLQVVLRAGAGIDNLDERVLAQRGISVLNAPEGNRDAVAEHCLGLLLALLNHLPSGNRQVRQGLWQREAHRGHELGPRTVGLVGVGHMGQAFARRLQCFGCRILGYDKYKAKEDFPSFVEKVDLPELQRQSDILSLHVPLTEETRGFFGPGFLRAMKKKFYFLNTSRGKVANLEALLEGLQAGKVVGAGLDVLENEDFSSQTTQERQILESLAEEEAVLFSPHVAGWSFESYERINSVLAEKLATYLGAEM